MDWWNGQKTHEAKGQIFRKKKPHRRSSDQCPHHYPGDIGQGNDTKRKNFRHRVHRDYFIKELKISRGRNPGKKLVYRICWSAGLNRRKIRNPVIKSRKMTKRLLSAQSRIRRTRRLIVCQRLEGKKVGETNSFSLDTKRSTKKASLKATWVLLQTLNIQILMSTLL